MTTWDDGSDREWDETKMHALPLSLQNTWSDTDAFNPWNRINPGCLPESLTSFEFGPNYNVDVVELSKIPQKLTLTLPYEEVAYTPDNYGGCLLQVQSFYGELYGSISWQTTSCRSGGLVIHTQNGVEGVGTFPWKDQVCLQTFSEYEFGLEALSVTRFVCEYANGERYFVRAQAAYADLHAVTLSLGVQKFPSCAEVPVETIHTSRNVEFYGRVSVVRSAT